MKVTEIVVSYGLTESLPGYGNVKVSESCKVELEEGDDVKHIEEGLYAELRDSVEKAVDTRFMQAGEPPIFYQGPRYRVLCEYTLRILAVLPELCEPPSGDWQSIGYHTRGWTKGQASSQAWKFKAERGEGWTLVDCTEGAEGMNALEALVADRQKEYQQEIEAATADQDDFIEEDEWEDD